jgi:hypothetical protein
MVSATMIWFATLQVWPSPLPPTSVTSGRSICLRGLHDRHRPFGDWPGDRRDIDVQKEIIEYDPDADAPLPVVKPQPNRKAIDKALDMLAAAERPLIVAGGGIINAEASDLLVEFAELTNTPVVPTLMGWGTIPDDHRLNAGMVGLQTQHRHGNATFLDSDFVLGIGNRWANRHTGSIPTYTQGRKFVHIGALGVPPRVPFDAQRPARPGAIAWKSSLCSFARGAWPVTQRIGMLSAIAE